MAIFLSGKETQSLDKERLMKVLVMHSMQERLSQDLYQEEEMDLLLYGQIHLKNRK